MDMPRTACELSHERELVKQAQQKDRDAFCTLYRHYLPRIHAYVAYRVGNKPDTEDIVANVFAKVIEHLPTFEYREDGSFRAWLFTIARHKVADFQRQPTPEHLSLDDIPEIQSKTLSPEQAVLRKEQFLYLRHLISTLSPRRQEVITLRVFGGLHNQEIAAVLDLDEHTVASYLCRALEDMRQRYVSGSERESKV